MKNKFITICVILAVLMSLASLAAVIVQLRSNDIEESIETEETEEATELIETVQIYEVVVTDNFSGDTPVELVVRFEEGMTWAEWVNSEYNTYGWVVVSGQINTPSTGTLMDNNDFISSDALIDVNEFYYF